MVMIGYFKKMDGYFFKVVVVNSVSVEFNSTFFVYASFGSLILKMIVMISC